jgi:hypothetical protein
MKHKALSIAKKVPQATILPDGYYPGRWCSNIIDVKLDGVDYEITTEEGIRGNSPVVVEIKNGVITFDLLKQ